MGKASAHSNIFQTSDFLLTIVLLVSFLLELKVPTTLLKLGETTTSIMGICILLASWSVIISAKITLGRHMQESRPGAATTQIVKTGIFGLSRNPIYLGVVGISIAIALMVNSVWVLISSAILATLLYVVLIRPEEKYLEGIFGNDYVEYKNQTRMWL